MATKSIKAETDQLLADLTSAAFHDAVKEADRLAQATGKPHFVTGFDLTYEISTEPKYDGWVRVDPDGTVENEAGGQLAGVR
jgi:hypothetical protein